MSRYQILYVDDEEDNLMAFKAVFRRHYEITTALSGQQALEILESHQPHIIIVDQRMPGMTGASLLEQVREKYPDIIRMILTGYSDIKAIIQAINNGKIYHYMTKPWDFDKVKVVLDNALETYELRKKNAELEKENALAQFEVLKNQLNPHFLFNSLNILRALITEDARRAVDYTTNFSKLYRKLLTVKEQTIVSLAEELDFIKHYISLQKTRFEDSLIINTELPEAVLQDCLPPFTLQLLIENAIKHNVISSEQPLQIDISTESAYLIVKNNLQQRQGEIESIGIGLSNLKARYALLTSQELYFSETDGQYIVRVPLIQSL